MPGMKCSKHGLPVRLQSLSAQKGRTDMHGLDRWFKILCCIPFRTSSPICWLRKAGAQRRHLLQSPLTSRNLSCAQWLCSGQETSRALRQPLMQTHDTIGSINIACIRLFRWEQIKIKGEKLLSRACSVGLLKPFDLVYKQI